MNLENNKIIKEGPETMNCWKSLNLSKEFGSVRLVILSLFGMICYFVIFNLTFTNLFGSQNITDFNALVFLCCLLLVYPVHKLLHCLPIWLFGRKVRLTFDRETSFLKLFCDITGVIPKRLYMVVILFPLIFMTVGLSILTLCFPNGIDYYLITGTVNFGISTTDLLYFVYIISAPRHAIIEDDRDGCHILIKHYL
jgi:hypothetical protein